MPRSRTPIVLDLEGAALEGARAKIYKAGDFVEHIVVTLLGETGRTKILYHFVEQGDYLAILTKDYYSEPIGKQTPQVVATSYAEITFCDGAYENFPGKTDFSKEVEEVSSILAIVRQQLP